MSSDGTQRDPTLPGTRRRPDQPRWHEVQAVDVAGEEVTVVTVVVNALVKRFRLVGRRPCSPCGAAEARARDQRMGGSERNALPRTSTPTSVTANSTAVVAKTAAAPM